MTGSAALLWLLSACDPFARWPEPGTGFPHAYTPLTDLEPYEQVRFETGTWEPLVDLEETALSVRKSLDHRAGAPLEELVHFGLARPGAIVESHPRLSVVGDIMPMSGAVAGFAQPASSLLDGDLRIGNLETPVSTLHPTERSELVDAFGLYAFNAPVELIDGLPLDVLQLTNNHTLDVGVEGFADTALNVEAAGITPLGFDGNGLLTALPDGVVVGLLAYTWGSNTPVPDGVDIGIVPFGLLEQEIDLARVRDDAAALRELGASHVVLLAHWGFEYEYWPDPHFMVLGRRLVAAGADVVVGHGPHTPQAAELCAVDLPLARPDVGQCAVRSGVGEPRVAAILYSLGNFGTDLATIPLQVGIVGSVSLDPRGGVSGLGWAPVARVVEDGTTRVVPMDDLVLNAGSTGPYAEESARLDTLLGTRWRRSR